MAYMNSDHFSKYKILLVDDQEDMLQMMTASLRDFGITRVFTANEGDKALRIFNRSLSFIDLVICDWNLPKKSGADILREIRLIRPDIPFLMVTGRCDMDSVFVAQKLGVTAYLSKPFSPTDFEKKVKMLIKKIPEQKKSHEDMIKA